MSRQSLIDGHTRSAERAVANAKCFKTMAAHFGELSELSKAMDTGPADILQGLSGECGAMADGCTDDAEFHVNAAKELSANNKSMLSDQRDEIMPSPISRIVPSAPARAVPRFGAPSVQKAVVSEQFRSLVAVDEQQDGE
jgi:hypothetical protein